MKALGIAIQKGELYFSVLEGSKNYCKVISSDKIIFRPESNPPELMYFFENTFNELITKYKPDRIAYKLSLNQDLKQMSYLSFPIGVLNLICYKKEIPITQRSISWIIASSKKKQIECQKHFAFYKENIKGSELDALLVSWHEMEN